MQPSCISISFAYRLLNSSNLTNEQIQLIKDTVSNTEYQIMKNQLHKVSTKITVDKKEDFKTEIKI